VWYERNGLSVSEVLYVISKGHILSITIMSEQVGTPISQNKDSSEKLSLVFCVIMIYGCMKAPSCVGVHSNATSFLVTFLGGTAIVQKFLTKRR
jgi:hypothetical protein